MTLTTQTQSLSNDFGNFYKATQAYVGMKFNSASALGVGSKLNSWQMSLKASTSGMSGTVYARLYDSSGTQKEQSTTTYSASSINTTTFTNYPFTFSGSTTISNGDYIVCYYDGGDPSYISAEWQTTDVYDGTDSCWITENGGVITSGDAKFELQYTTGSPASSGTRLPPPPAFVRI
jgi:uncharacterized protein (UPF0333 family)